MNPRVLTNKFFYFINVTDLSDFTELMIKLLSVFPNVRNPFVHVMFWPMCY